ncbi:MAG: hypothetical protein HDR25_02160 [Lachnospiraceae bacterium]|nr:hypothetical protein [Lachnospiraceae bacterium]
MNTYYLVDYENVGDDGLSNCHKLDKTDHIHIFYTGDKTRININILNNGSNSELKVHKVQSGNQSVDMHLVFFLGYLLGINEDKDCSYVIISKDKGYDKVIAFWKDQKNDRIVRAVRINPPISNQSTAIAQTSKKSNGVVNQPKNKNGKIKTRLNQEVQHEMSDSGYCNEDINNVAKIVVKQYGQDNFLRSVHNALRKEYDADACREIYQDIKNVLKKYEKS